MRWRSSWRPSRARLDLLLYLIRKQNFNILDIPLADVTRQYLAMWTRSGCTTWSWRASTC